MTSHGGLLEGSHSSTAWNRWYPFLQLLSLTKLSFIPQLGYFQFQFRSLACKTWGVSPVPSLCICVLVMSENYAAHSQLCRCSWKLQVPHFWKSNPDVFQPKGTVFPCCRMTERSEGFVILGQKTVWNNRMNWGGEEVLKASGSFLCMLDNIFYTHFLWLSLLLLRPRISQIKQQGSLLCVSCLHFSIAFLHSLPPSNGSWGKSAEYSTNDMKKNTEESSREAKVLTTLPPLPRKTSVTSWHVPWET